MHTDSKMWALVPLAAAINIVCGFIASILKLPIYLDSIGTILAACIAGPLASVCTALIGAVISALISSPIFLAFSPVAVIIGVISAYLIKRNILRTYSGAIFMGLILGTISALISSVITANVFQGSTGGGQDIIVASFRYLGFSTWHACLMQCLLVDPIDKIVSCLMVQIVLLSLPKTIFDRKIPLPPSPLPLSFVPTFKKNEDSYLPDCDTRLQNRRLYRPGRSILHETSITTKLLLIVLTAIYAFSFSFYLDTGQNIYPLAYLPLLFIFLLLLAFISKVGSHLVKTILGIILPLSFSMILLNGLFSVYPGEDRFIQLWGGISLCELACWHAAQTCMRLCLLCQIILIVFFTTPPNEWQQYLEVHGFSPRFTYAFISCINFLPNLRFRIHEILITQGSRGVPLGKSWRERLYNLLNITPPLLTSTIYASQQRALALEVRGFGISPRRTWLKPLKRNESYIQIALVIIGISIIIYSYVQN